MVGFGRRKRSGNRSAEARDLRRKHGEILGFSTIKEYYTKSEGLRFPDHKSRIDFRIEFRDVTLLDMNSIRQSIAERIFYRLENSNGA